MTADSPSRYDLVSRRAWLKGSLAVGAATLLSACGNSDAEVFAGASTQSSPTATPFPTPTALAAAEPDPVEPRPAEPTPTEAAPTPESVGSAEAVMGEMVVSFTYTQGAGGKNERPYVAVWVEDTAGNLLQTLSLWYQQERRGNRWLDHLSRWFNGDADRVAGGGVDNSVTISSATREPGAYAVVWDGSLAGAPAAPGDYVVCIESSREDGPYSLICQPVPLLGTLAETPLPDNGELSFASVRIDATS